MDPDAERPLRILSLGKYPLSHGFAILTILLPDGGGIRGLSSLLILKHLMKRINKDNPPRPCEYFDLIGGTSTGG